jgi:hypothetical protein
MNSKDAFKYSFAILLSVIGGYGFITNTDGWYWWLCAALAYLTAGQIAKMLD